MANKTKIIRSVDSTPNHFTPLSNKLLQDMRMGIDTRGLLAFIISLPADWIVYKENIQKQLGFGRKKMDRMWSEAKQYGYLQSKKYRQSNGTWNYEYIVSDVPLSTAPLSNDGSSTGGKGGTKQSNHKQNTHLQNTQGIDIPIKGISNSISSSSIVDKPLEEESVFFNQEKMNTKSSLPWDDSIHQYRTGDDFKNKLQTLLNN